MVSLSKLLDQGLRDAKCYEVYHPGRTCLKFQFENSATCLIKCLKYFFPIVAVPLLIKGRNLRKKHVRDAFNYYMELILTGFLISQTVPMAQCGIREVCGKFTKCNFMYLPMTLPTWTVCFISPRTARLFGASMFQVTFETFVRNSKNGICIALCQSKVFRALLFMTCSAFVLHTLQTHNLKTFWFIKNISKPIKNDHNKCSHNGTCSRFCLYDLAKNISIGLSIDLVKTFIGNLSSGKRFFNDLGRKLVTLNFSTTFFLSAYSLIYRVTSCLLNQLQEYDTHVPLKHIIAAFLGGISYFFLPKLAILSYAISVCIELSWELFKQQKFENDLKLVETIKKIPFHRIFICLTAGYLVETYVLRPEVLSPLGFTIVSVFTGDRAPDMKADIYKYFKSIQ